MTNRMRVVFLSMWFLCAAAMPAGAEIIDRVVAVVGDDVVTQYELDSTVELLIHRYGQNIPPENRARILAEAQQAVLSRMIDDMVLRQEARKQGITIRDEDVTNTIQDGLKRRNMSMDEMRQALAREGSSVEKYREATRSDMIKMRLIQKEIRPRVSVSPDEIGAFYMEHRDEYEGKERARLQLILFRPAQPGEEALARQKAADALKRIKAGEPFEYIADENTPGPQKTGGDIGFVEKGAMSPAIDEAVSRLKPGEVSEVIETEQGCYIVKVLEKRGGGSISIRATRESVEERIFREKMDKRFAEWMTEKKNKTHIEIRL